MRRDWSWGLAAVGGLALGLGILSKYPMVLVYPVLGYLFWTSDRGAARARLAFLVSVSVAIALAWLGLSFHIGIFQLQSGTLTGFSLSVAETIWGKWMFLEVATTRVPSALGVYSLPALIMARGLDQLPQATEKGLWLLLVECALALYLFVDWSRASHLFIDEYKGLMP